MRVMLDLRFSISFADMETASLMKKNFRVLDLKLRVQSLLEQQFLMDQHRQLKLRMHLSTPVRSTMMQIFVMMLKYAPMSLHYTTHPLKRNQEVLSSLLSSRCQKHKTSEQTSPIETSSKWVGINTIASWIHSLTLTL